MKLFWGEADFNLILERILDSKYFSSNSKSLLFSTVYKIESFYEDYKTVKAIDKTKEEFLHEILEDIKKYCDNIRLIEPDSESAKILKDNNVLALTNEKERSLLAYPTETSILYAISDVIPKYFYIPDSFSYKNALQQLLVNGYNENNLEVLSDFNGWSWDINLKVKRNLQDSLIFQNILILLGLHFLEDWMNETEKNSNKLAKLKKTFANTKYFDYLCKYLLLNLPPKDKVKIEIRDYGPMLPMDVWREMKRGWVKKPTSIAMRPGSSGLGLYIASKFSRYMNAKVGVVRHRDGTSFYVDLPVSTQASLF